MNNNDILKALINAVKRSYAEYRLANNRYLESSFIDEDGKLCFIVAYKELVDAAEKLYCKDRDDLARYRSLLKAGDQDEINKFLAAKGFDIDEIG